ncbi:MAG: adenylate/guanylate cyclase domain-containing protein [Chloroflexota bacterium]
MQTLEITPQSDVDTIDWSTLYTRLARYVPPTLLNQLNEHSDNIDLSGEAEPQFARLVNEAVRTLQPLHRTLVQYMPHYLIELDLTPGEPHGALLEGSFVHADLKGFTALTELMARQGSEQGQEAMNKMLNALFKGLLDPLIASGGDLLIFAGDAILAYFPQQEDGTDVLQATRAGLRMERAILPFATVENEFGQCELSMRIGIERGTAYAGVVGTNQRMELLVSGPGIYDAMEAEEASLPGQVRLGNRAVKIAADHVTFDDQIVVDDLGAELGDYEVQLPRRRRGSSVIMSHDTLELLSALDKSISQVERLAPFIPEDFLVKLVNTSRRRKLNVEFRPVTVQFVHISGLENLALEQGVEFATEVFQHYFVRAQALINEQEGIVSQVDAYHGGFFLLNTFGSPTMHEGTARYAVAAALQLDKLLVEVNKTFALDPPLSQRVGVTYGRTFNGEIGANYRRESVIAGPSVNLASRLMSQAQSGQIIIDEALWNQTDNAFIADHLPAVMLKGIDHPVEIVNVSGFRFGCEIPEPEWAVVGHEFEQEWVRQDVQKLQKGQGSAWMLSGETGLGKTTFVATMIHWAEAKDYQVLIGRCQPHGKGMNFFPWLDSLAGLSKLGMDAKTRLSDNDAQTSNGDWKDLPAKISQQITQLLMAPLLQDPSPTQTIENQTTLIVETLTNLAQEKPMIIVLEDSHWLDPASRQVLDKLIERTKSLPVMLVVTGIRPIPGLNLLPLQPLSYSAIARISSRVFGAETLEPKLETWICQQAGGNPLYAEALCQALQASDGVVLDNKTGVVRWTGLEPAMPITLHEILLARFDALPFVQQEALKRGAVMGTSFIVEGVCELTDEEFSPDEIYSALQAATQAGLLTADLGDRYTFNHILMKEAIYATLSFSQRKLWHGKLSAWLLRQNDIEQDYVLELIAYHYLRSADGEKGAQFGRQAGDRAQERGAYVKALDYYQQVFDLPDAPRVERIKAARGWANVLSLQGRADAAKLAHERAENLVQVDAL